ncbi:MAG: glycerol-3-phosphate 1-O-acyltransferase PlsY [Brevinematia bacterium]
MWDIVFLLVSFLLGSIPFGKIVASFKGKDITKEGSGNIGATNVFRTVGKVWGIVVLILDALKGGVPTFVTLWLYKNNILPFYLPEVYVFAGVSAILGHTFSPFVGFRGGKGVATSLGVFIVLTPVGTLVGVVVFLISLLIFRIVSISSIISSISVFSYLLVSLIVQGEIFKNLLLLFTAFAVMLLIIVKHIPNIRRLVKGEERRIV